MEKVILKNICNATISLYLPEIRFNRELIPGRSITIEKSVYEDLTFDPGFNSLVNTHSLLVEGLDKDEEVVDNSKVFTKDDIAKMFDTNDITQFAKFIPNAAPAEKETVVDLAVEKGITNSGFVSLIKKYCDRDVIELINMKHLAED